MVSICRAKGIFIALLFLFAWSSHAFEESYHLASPLGWMHQLPVGEKPGWTGDIWFDLDVNVANIWNAPTDFINLETGDRLHYHADFEQFTQVLSFGFAMSEKFACEVELPVAHRWGGGLDPFIDEFHRGVGSERFSREDYPQNLAKFVLQTNGVDELGPYLESGLSNTRLKLKFWPWKFADSTPYGLSTTLQAKVPLQSSSSGLSSGNWDYSAMVHLGFPVGWYSGIWFTAGSTILGENPAWSAWPRRKWIETYEMSTDMAFSERWAFVFQLRLESPLMDREKLAIDMAGLNQEQMTEAHLASGWNALAEWRASQGVGLRYRNSTGSYLKFLFIEDWGLGSADNNGDFIYTGNAPDFTLAIQMGTSF
jgi:hypothetical protein